MDRAGRRRTGPLPVIYEKRGDVPSALKGTWYMSGLPQIFQNLARSKGFWILCACILLVWLNNTSWPIDRSDRTITLVAHAGLGQTYDLDGVQWNTNTAARIHPPEHEYIENTIPSIQAAFAYGADIVECDVRLTADQQLAVFHDYRLDYRTNGHGLVSDHTMAELRQLDVGYGYTADQGTTFPFRGKGMGLMVTLEEVLRTFPDRHFLIHIKDGGTPIGHVLLNFLQTLDTSQIQQISVYGNDTALDLLRAHYPQMQILSKAKMKAAVVQYMLLGWTGLIPDAIRGMELHLPLQYAQWLWGWPDRFLQRMERVNTRVVLVQYEQGWSKGFNSCAELQRLPPQYTGALWTDRIDRIGPLLKP